MKNITLDECISLQESFFHDGVFSPFEFVEDYHVFYPLAIIGEVGSLVNNFCKKIRSPNDYSSKIRNESADVFVYFLLFGRMIEKNEGLRVFGKIKENWDEEPSIIKDDFNFKGEIDILLKKISLFSSTEKNECYTEEFFYEIFKLIKDINFYVTGSTWQEIINEFHINVIKEFTNIKKYSPDLWYNGSCYVNFSKIIDFIKRNEVEVPKKVFLFLDRIEKLQSVAKNINP